MRTLSICAAMVLVAAVLPAANTLDIYAIDVEGSGSMLIVTPSGQSILMDGGWEGLNDEKWRITKPDDRDADRVVEAIKASKVKQIDYLVVTHYDNDHVGNIPRVVAKLPVPVRAFVDHGSPVAENPDTQRLYNAYLAAVGKTKRISVKPGDRIPMKGLDVVVVSSHLEVLQSPLPGAGTPNPFCEAGSGKPMKGENPASLGLVFTFGKFRTIYLGDLTTGKEMELMCPNNRLGATDLFIVSHHGFNMSNSKALVHAIRPLVAIMPNGAKKGGQAAAWQNIRTSPGLEDIWQLHYTVDVGDENNAPEQYIANPQKEPDPRCFGCVLGDQAHWILASVQSDGTFKVTNRRNGFSKTYKRQR